MKKNHIFIYTIKCEPIICSSIVSPFTCEKKSDLHTMRPLIGSLGSAIWRPPWITAPIDLKIKFKLL